MKKFLFCLSLVFVVTIAGAQYKDTLMIFNFNVQGSNAPTFVNQYNIGNTISRESTFTSSYNYPPNGNNYSLSTNGWVNSLSNESGYYLQLSTTSRSGITVTSYLKSSITGPKYLMLQYKIGNSGSWTNVNSDTIKCSSAVWVNFPYETILPALCDYQPLLYLRWLAISDSNTSGGLIDAAGTLGIDNIRIISIIYDVGDVLDINSVKPMFYCGGLNFFDDISSCQYEYPIDSNKHTIFSSALWVGGKYQNNLYLTGERFHGNGRDYNQGPVMNPIYFPAEFSNWNKVWKINKSEIDNHVANWNSPGYVIPASINQWPVYSNPALGINYYLAPFEDADSNGSYNPGGGDFPKIRGDQAIYFIYNDSVAAHTETGGKRMGVEVHGLAYAYNTNPLLDKTIFVSYLIYNRSQRTYDSLYLGVFSDIDIGYAKDDYIGCDSSLNTYFGYNGDSYDETGGGAHGYGLNPPVQTVTLLNQPMSSFIYFNNDMSVTNDPDIANEYYNYMKAIWRDGTHMRFGGNGHINAGGTGSECHFMFSGYPLDTTQWNEVNAGNPPSDRRGVGAVGPLSLLPGAYIALDIAYITADSLGSKGYGTNINNMYSMVPQIIDFFNNNLPQNGSDLALSVENGANESDFSAQFTIFPNPTHDQIFVTSNISLKNMLAEIYDIDGRLVINYKLNSQNDVLNVSFLRSGIYILKISNNSQRAFYKFVKM